MSARPDLDPPQRAASPPAAPAAADGPNWGLALFALVVIGAAAMTLLTQVFDVHLDTASLAPGALVVGGLVLVLVGQIGLIRQRRRRR